MELIGVNLNGFNNWYSKGIPNSSTGNIGIIVNAYANLLQEKFFWRNFSCNKFRLNKNIETDNDNFESATDVFSITFLYGIN